MEITVLYTILFLIWVRKMLVSPGMFLLIRTTIVERHDVKYSKILTLPVLVWYCQAISRTLDSDLHAGSR